MVGIAGRWVGTWRKVTVASDRFDVFEKTRSRHVDSRLLIYRHNVTEIVSAFRKESTLTLLQLRFIPGHLVPE